MERKEKWKEMEWIERKGIQGKIKLLLIGKEKNINQQWNRKKSGRKWEIKKGRESKTKQINIEYTEKRKEIE